VYGYWGIPPKPTATALATFLKQSKSFSDDEIVRLSNIAKQSGGTKKVGNELGKLNLRNDQLEDIYIRIAVHQSSLTRIEAQGMFDRLNGTPGFRTTLRKIIGASEVKTAGHLNELRISDHAVQQGLKAKGIGVRFDDGVKSADTDIDVLLAKGNTQVAVEAKFYSPSTSLPFDKFQADMISLTKYSESQLPNRVIKVFSMTGKESDFAPEDVIYLKKIAENNGVELIFGTPQEQVILIKGLL